MIFHTAADPLYYNHFYQNYYQSIKKNYPDSRFSLHLVGNISNVLNVDFLTNEMITLDEIKGKFSCDEKNARGYFCMSRWTSIPITNSHVCVSDVDIIAVDKIDNRFVEANLDRHRVINLTRIKNKTGKEGGMMIFFLHKDVCETIKQYANNVLKNHKLEWASDVLVRNFIYENYDVKNVLKMQETSKSSSVKIDNPWFIFSKVGKFKNLTNF
jgi:hypothetical protein